MKLRLPFGRDGMHLTVHDAVLGTSSSGAVVFAVVVLATGMPVSALLAQRHQLSSASTELTRLHQENGSLHNQARQLSDPATVGALARTDYGLVPSGDKSYDILPTSGSSGATAPGTGHVPLNGPPVVPGSGESADPSRFGSFRPELSRNGVGDDGLRARTSYPGPVGAGARYPRVLALSAVGPRPRRRRAASPGDVEAVARLLGRPPAGCFTVVVRSPGGEPAVIENEPFLDDGRPMPTRVLVGGPTRCETL